jgi:hypothetical protein
MEFSGSVVKKMFGKGSKSEREGIFLVTDQGEYLLRRQGGNPFRDPVLEELAGSKITCEGKIYDYTLIITSWKRL